jgi:hypothetical protein
MTTATATPSGSAARASLARCRQILNMETDPAAIAWGGMRPVDRVFLLIGAELPQRWQQRHWADLSAADRHRITAAAPRVAAWAGRIARAFAGEVLQ